MTDFHKTRKELSRQRELMSAACEDAHMWVFTLNIQTGNIILEPAARRTLHLSSDVPDYIDKLIASDSILASYAGECRRVLEALKSGEKTAEAVIRTKIRSSKPHWVRFRARTAEYDKSGAPLLAACSAQVIDKEVALRTRVRFEHEQIIDSRKDLMGYVVSDISKNTVLESKKTMSCGPVSAVGAPYDEAVKAASADIEPEEDRVLFLQKHDRAALLRQFAEGELEQDIDYQFMQSDGKLLWAHSKMKLMLHPDNGDVILYEYCFSAHSAKIMKGLLSSSADNGYDLLGAVSLLNDQVAKLSFTPSGICEDDALVFSSYTEETRLYCGRCVAPEERAGFLRATARENLLKELKDKSVYRMSYKEISADGTLRTKIAQYTLYDKKRQFCLLSILDMHKLIASINDIHTSNTEEKE